MTDATQSPTIGKLAEALVKAQAEFGPLRKGKANPFFKSKYADLAAVIDVIREPFAENGLAWRLIVLRTELRHPLPERPACAEAAVEAREGEAGGSLIRIACGCGVTSYVREPSYVRGEFLACPACGCGGGEGEE